MKNTMHKIISIILAITLTMSMVLFSYAENIEPPETFVNPIEDEYFYSFNNILGNCGIFTYFDKDNYNIITQINPALIKDYIDLKDKALYEKWLEVYNTSQANKTKIINTLNNSNLKSTILSQDATWDEIFEAINGLKVNVSYGSSQASNVEREYHVHSDECYADWCTYTVPHNHTSNCPTRQETVTCGCTGHYNYMGATPVGCPSCGHTHGATIPCPNDVGSRTVYCCGIQYDLAEGWASNVPSGAAITSRGKRLRCTRNESAVDKKIIYF